ncbi:phage tail protein [Motilimonas sp. KMU-193]|uniref:phage tail protein n=1 Tax=Motilimonas sp. KMU-193 TaxID=3388668 RepID=UPI00396B4239
MAEPFLGEMRIFPYTFAPKHWAMCDGTIVPISQNPALFALLGNHYGGDGQSNFGLPDMRGRVPIGPGTLGSDAYQRGNKGGLESVALSLAEMPAHTHELYGDRDPSGGRTAPGLVGTRILKSTDPNRSSIFGDPPYGPATNMIALDPKSSEVVGKGLSHENMQPSLVMNFCIAQTGVFPPRS